MGTAAHLTLINDARQQISEQTGGFLNKRWIGFARICHHRLCEDGFASLLLQPFVTAIQFAGMKFFVDALRDPTKESVAVNIQRISEPTLPLLEGLFCDPHVATYFLHWCAALPSHGLQHPLGCEVLSHPPPCRQSYSSGRTSSD